MSSSITLKNLANTEFKIEHPDGIPAKTISSKDMTVAVDTVAAMQALTPHDGMVCIVRDLDRGGTFIYDSTKVLSSNQGTNFIGWVRQYSGAINVKWFGGINPTSVYLKSTGGGGVEVSEKSGSIQTLPVKMDRVASVTSLNIVGNNIINTKLDFSGSLESIYTDIDSAVYFSVRDLSVFNSPTSGLNFKNGYSRADFTNLLLKDNDVNGFTGGIGWLANLTNVHSVNNLGNGYSFTEDITTHNISNCYAEYNTFSGYTFLRPTSSVLSANAGDRNGQYGMVISGGNTTTVLNNYFEYNNRSALSIRSSNIIGEVDNIVIDGVRAYKNNVSTGYGNLLYAQALDGKKCDVKLLNSVSIPTVGNTEPCVTAYGVGAVITMNRQTLPNGWQTLSGGYINWIHDTLLVNQVPVVVSTAKAICNLLSTQGHKGYYAGEITVVCGNDAPSNTLRGTSIYKLLVSKSSAGGGQVSVIASLGATSGASATSPSFTWTLSADKLYATPVSLTGGGNFWFEVSTASQITVTSI